MSGITPPPRVPFVTASGSTQEGFPVEVAIEEDRGWRNWFYDLADKAPNQIRAKVTLDPVSVSPGVAEQSFTVNGLRSDHIIQLNKPTLTAGLGIVGLRATSDTLHITFHNTTGGAIDPPSEVYFIIATRM